MLSSVLRRTPHFKGKARLLHALCPLRGSRDADLFGYRVRLDLSDYIERCAYLGIFEPEETRAVQALLKPGMTFVDVGANIGYYTLLASRAVGDAGVVYAFEPSTAAFGKLRTTLQSNDIANVRAFQLALGSEECRLSLGAGPEDNFTPSLLTGGGEEVAVTTLDAFVTEQGIGRIDLIKIDVEGFEPFVLQGGRRVLSDGTVGAVLCELNDYWLGRAGTNTEAVYESMREMGFGRTVSYSALSDFANVLFTR